MSRLTLIPDSVTVVPHKLTDGSYVYDVCALSDEHQTVEFACDTRESALALKALLDNGVVNITVHP